MQNLIRISAAALLIVIFFVSAAAQQTAQDRAAALHAQLAEVQTQQAEMQVRLAQLEEALKPENIASSLAGVGSTHPEILREQRRKQLETEKAGVNTQLERLAISQRRLEVAVGEADAVAYQQSAQPSVPSASTSTSTKGPNATTVENPAPTRPRTTRHRTRRARAKRS
jgi:hypothetical protein